MKIPAPHRLNRLMPLVYTASMSSVADELRKDTLEEMQRLTPGERVSLALELGDFDLSLFCAHQGLEPEIALERLRRARQVGRRKSAPVGSTR